MLCHLKNVSFKYDKLEILKSINLSINSGEIISIIGPSGTGKTTLLKILAGLTLDYSGELILDPSPSLESPVIIVFQDYMLFPHMTVFQNVSFGLKTRKLGKEEVETRVTEYLKYFGLEEKRDALPSELSAGQKQRVAIARAMVVKPALLLLDEPFANLDYNLKAETARFIRDTQKHFGVTTVCVTHDQREAFSISDRIGVLLDGELVETQSVKDLFNQPKDIRTAQFMGSINIIPRDYLSDFIDNHELPQKDLYCRANGITLTKNSEGPGRIMEVNYSGELIQYLVKHRNLNYTINSTIDSLQVGDRVNLHLLKYIEID